MIRPRLPVVAVVAVPLLLPRVSSVLLWVAIQVAVYGCQPHTAMLLDLSPATEASVATA